MTGDQRFGRHPDLDVSAKHLTSMIIRLARLFENAYNVSSAPLGLSAADFGVLAPLRHVGEPFELTPTELAKLRGMTSGGMTAALDRLEGKGFLIRMPNPNDRRGRLVRLTDVGLDVVNAALGRNAEVRSELLRGLASDEQRQLTDLLGRLLVSLDPAAEHEVCSEIDCTPR